jgi:hypothetical protein
MQVGDSSAAAAEKSGQGHFAEIATAGHIAHNAGAAMLSSWKLDMRRLITAFGCVSMVFVQCSSRASAQKITVQEPSLETFSVGTTVSAPDRGRVSLGGVGRGAASRSISGPFRRGTSMGLSSQGSGLSVGVRVQDLAELDRATLDAAAKARKAGDDVRLPAGAEHAFNALQSRRAERDVASEARSAVVAEAPGRRETRDAPAYEGPSADKLLDRARLAENAGKRELALAYLRVARDRGSDTAKREIERLTARTSQTSGR